MTVFVNQKIKDEHLKRKAIVYIRQSSPKQVKHNLESQRLQYALAERARQLGWRQVEVVDSDLGASASVGAKRRDGFEEVLGRVALGVVGIVLSREVSRLSRTDKDFCRLLEVCQLFGTLIGDGDQIYDLDLMDDQLVLGIKGTLSVVELKVLRMRMLQGRHEKARRGELHMRLPTGYVHDEQGRVVKDPNLRAQEVIEMVFRKFREVWTIRQTFKWFQDHGIDLPVNNVEEGTLSLSWKPPTQQFISHLLHNPFYAGAYFFGRRQREKTLVDGQVVTRTGPLREPEECRIFIRDHHEGYIDWETYEENQRMIQRNTWNVSAEESVQSIRSGHGLLVGLLRCGHCGRRLHVRYWGRSGTNARYLCKGDYDNGGNYCLSFAGRQVDERFSEELLATLSPLGIEASLEAIEQLESSRDERRTALARQVEQLTYEARRAFEQYDEADPRNRLVATELERRWNAKLEELEKARGRLAQLDQNALLITDFDRKRIRSLGERFVEVWSSESCPMKLKKQIVQTAVEELVVTFVRETGKLNFVIHWKGGTHTEFDLKKSVRWAGPTTPVEALEIIRCMAFRYSDGQIASVLTRHGHRTANGLRWNEGRVYAARRRHEIDGQRRFKTTPGLLTLSEAARYCDVSRSAIERLAESGLLKMDQVVRFAPWEIWQEDLDTEPVRGVLEQLRRTGKLVLEGGAPENQQNLFDKNQGDDNARYRG